jgi:hypothetical protein
MSLRLKTQLAELPTTLPNPKRSGLPWWRTGGVVLVFFGLHTLTSPPADGEATPEFALVAALAEEHELSASPSDVFWVDPPPPWWKPWQTGRAWVLAAHGDGLDDVYLVRTRRSPEGAFLDVGSVYNLSDTHATAERLLTASGREAAWYAGTNEDLLRVTWASLGESPLDTPSASELSALQRLQWQLTWRQGYGEWRGVTRRQFKLIPPASAGFARFHGQATGEIAAVDSDGELELLTNHGQVRLSRTTVSSEGQHVAEQSSGLAKPGNLITWSVDRLRATPWFGDENMQRLKAVVYRVWDAASRRYGIGVDADETRVTVVANPAQPTPVVAPTSDLPTDLQRLWPPPPLTPLLEPPEQGEGVWLSLNNDPFIKPSNDPRGIFYTTFIRTDSERTYARIIVTIWDPLTVRLHTQSGTEEPKTATGETGSGLVPRDIAENLVAAFNGGFQATHGDFGMVAEGVTYVPPLPFAATIATDLAGNVGFGTWPESQALPANLVGLRQNLTPLVAGGKFNPYQRTWWGGVPSGWEDDTHTVRSGLCLTEHGHVAYFYGAKVDAENLAKAMLASQCTYGVHLDMNQGHTGLEFYHVAPEAELPPLALTLDRVWQAEGPVSDAPGLAFRGRRMFRAMQLMNFPRYIQRETRDFFYLTLRPTLPRPGWTIPPSSRDVYPPAVATRTTTLASGALVHLWELAPEYVTPSSNDAGLVVSTLSAPTVNGNEDETQSREFVTWHDGNLAYARAPLSEGAVALLSTWSATEAEAMVCLQASGNLLYAEVASARGSAAEALTTVLIAEGCSLETLRGAPVGAIGLGGRDLSGHPREDTTPEIHLRYRRPRRHFDVFPDTPVVPPAHWRPLQAKRR